MGSFSLLPLTSLYGPVAQIKSDHEQFALYRFYRTNSIYVYYYDTSSVDETGTIP